MCHSGKLKEFPGKVKFEDYPNWGTTPDKHRGGNVKFGFSNWKVSGSKIEQHKEQAFGPILFTQHSISSKVLEINCANASNRRKRWDKWLNFKQN